MVQTIILIILLFFMSGTISATGKWNVFIADWNNLTAKKDASVGIIIRKAIQSKLDKDSAFLVSVNTNASLVTISDYQQAVQAGRSYLADIAVYGDYYIQGDSLIVNCVVYDVLVKRIKLRKTYTGVATEDIFDTTDSIAQELVGKIREALPPLTEEIETAIKKIRKEVYETSGINVKRTFYTYFGVQSLLNSLNLQWTNSINEQQDFQGSIPISTPCIGFSMRYWDLRIDLTIGGLPGLPGYDWSKGRVLTYNPLFFQLKVAYYLPWALNSLALSVAFQNEQQPQTTGGKTWDRFNIPYNFDAYGNNLQIGMIWNPANFLELSLGINPVFNGTATDGYSIETIKFLFPAMEFGTIFFVQNLGINARLMYARYNYLKNGSGGYRFSDSTALNLYLGLVYRIDFNSQK